MPKISVIIMVYNMADYLPRCLDSALGQTLADLEVIGVDDGSTDRSREILEARAARDPRLRVVSQPNQGTGGASNTGIKNAMGEYLCFLGADDYYVDDRALEDLLRAAEKSRAGVCGGGLVYYEDGKPLLDDSGELVGAVVREEGWRRLEDEPFPSGVTRFLFRRDFIIERGLYFTTHSRAQDTHWLGRVLEAAEKYYLITRLIYAYRVSHKTVEWNRRRRLDLLEVCLEMARFMDQRGYAEWADFFETSLWTHAHEFFRMRRLSDLADSLRPGAGPYRKLWWKSARYGLLARLHPQARRRAAYRLKQRELSDMLRRARECAAEKH